MQIPIAVLMLAAMNKKLLVQFVLIVAGGVAVQFLVSKLQKQGILS